MGTVGDSYDNALAENFFSVLKVELVYRTSFPTREEAELALIRYIDGWYNPLPPADPAQQRRRVSGTHTLRQATPS